MPLGSEEQFECTRTRAPPVDAGRKDDPPDHNVVVFPPPKPRSLGEPPADAELAALLDFVARRGASPTSDGSGPTDADTMLKRLLWEFGTDQARSMVESALALVTPLQGDAVAPEIAAMRAWLERHPR